MLNYNLFKSSLSSLQRKTKQTLKLKVNFTSDATMHALYPFPSVKYLDLKIVEEGHTR